MTCLISREVMEHPIKLPCNHSFEYKYLYMEIIEQLKITKKSYIFACPYCRTKYNNTLPYYEIDDVDKHVNINYKQRTTMPILQCQTCTTGIGHQYKSGIFCIPHANTNTCQATCKSGIKCKSKTKDTYCGIHKKYMI